MAKRSLLGSLKDDLLFTICIRIPCTMYVHIYVSSKGNITEIKSSPEKIYSAKTSSTHMEIEPRKIDTTKIFGIFSGVDLISIYVFVSYYNLLWLQYGKYGNTPITFLHDEVLHA